jgi:hypothetical protein
MDAKKPSQYIRPLFIIYMAANLVGVFLYLMFVVNTGNFAKMEQRHYYDFGDSLNFILFAWPVLLLCLLINVLWGIKAMIDIFRRNAYHALVVGVVVAAIWATDLWLCRYLAESAISVSLLSN